MTSMDTTGGPQDDIRRAATDELVRSLIAAGVSLVAGLALLWAMSHTADMARAAAWLADRTRVPGDPGPPPEYWAMLPGLHRDIRRLEVASGTMITDPGGPDE